ncbi:MAG: MBL fold metallo-hydrolase [Alicyclobacillus sp.]|nr:MBL fold metallo-hydrolase [Alicyclobacillus sp.]
MLWLWIVIAVVAALAVIAGTVLVQYARMRLHLPKPPYRDPALRPKLDQWPTDRVTATWIGHSTVFIQFYDVGILTDPVLFSRVGVRIFPGVVIGPKRYTGPALTAADLDGRVDLVLLSHAHLDHFDLPSLRRVVQGNQRQGGPEMVTAANTARLLRRLACGPVHELRGEASVQTEAGVRVTAVPVRHWGARFPWNRDYHWTGYVVEYRGTRILFAGDTAATGVFRGLADRYGPIDLAFMPIGAYAPDTFQGAHCTPEQAWTMFQESGARQLAPMHWNTFVLSMEPVAEPLQRLLAVAGAERDRIVLQEPGAVWQAAVPDWEPVSAGGRANANRSPR